VRVPTTTTLAAGACAAIALSGCARTLKSDDAAGQITKRLRARGVPVVRTGCPEVEAKRGSRVVCDIYLPHRRVAHGILIVLDRDGHYRFRLGRH
jgi:hypothetical protein